MHHRESQFSLNSHRLKGWGAALLSAVLGIGVALPRAQAETKEKDERSPQIVSDEELTTSGAVQELPPGTDPAAPLPVSPVAPPANPAPSPAPVNPIIPENPTPDPDQAAPVIPEKAAPAAPGPGLQGEAALKQMPGDGSKLLDPTKPVNEVRAAGVPGSGPGVSPLLPQDPQGGVIRPPLTTPDANEGVGRVQPVTATTPFKSESTPTGGPVVMGTELEPDAATSPLTPDQNGPDFSDDPVVESTDPWVFGVEVATVYDDNIRLSSQDAQQDFLFVLSASVAWQRGDVKRKRGSWQRVYYKATGVAFAEQSDENSLDHDFQAGAQKRWGSLALAMEGRFRRLSGATPDLGDRVLRNDFNVKASGTYDFSGRTFVEAGVAYNGVRYEEAGLADYDEWVAEGFAGYELSGRTRISAGGSLGRLDVAKAGSQDFQRALVKVNRVSTGSLGLTGKAGAEFRQTPQGDKTTPVFSLAADWEPVEDSTKVSVEVIRETVASGALAGENYQRTGAAVRVAQDLGSRFKAGLEAGYERLSYDAASNATSSGRSDDYLYVKPSLKYEFAARRRAEIFYSFREDDSSDEAFSFTANQWGLSFGLDF
jgi:hypothetical protein